MATAEFMKIPGVDGWRGWPLVAWTAFATIIGACALTPYLDLGTSHIANTSDLLRTAHAPSGRPDVVNVAHRPHRP